MFAWNSKISVISTMDGWDSTTTATAVTVLFHLTLTPWYCHWFFFSSCPLFGFFLSSKGIWCLVGKTWVATLHQARWDLFLKVWKSNLDLKSQARQLLNPCLSILLLFFRNCGVFFLSLGTIQVLRQKKGGWGRKMAIFADLQYYLCWRRWVGGPKKARNMVT